MVLYLHKYSTGKNVLSGLCGTDTIILIVISHGSLTSLLITKNPNKKETKKTKGTKKYKKEKRTRANVKKKTNSHKNEEKRNKKIRLP